MNASSGPPETGKPAGQGGPQENIENGRNSKVDPSGPRVKPGDILEAWIGLSVLVLARRGERFAGVLEAVSAGELLVRGSTGRRFVIFRSAVVYMRALEAFDTNTDAFMLAERVAWS